MKKLILSTLVVAAAIAVSVEAASAQFQPNFNTYNGSSTLSGQDGWDTNDLNQPDFVGMIPGYSTTLSDYWALLGGLGVGGGPAPDAPNTELFRPFTLPDAYNASFSVTFGISSSVTPQTAQDTFNWRFASESGSFIADLQFSPLNASTLGFQWRDDNTTNTTAFGISYDAKYDLVANITHLDGASNLEVLVRPSGGGSYTTFYNGSFVRGSNQGLGQVKALWLLSNSTVSGNGTYDGYGDNSLIFQNYSVVSVPEPTVLVLAFGAGLAFLLFRRMRKTA